LRLLKTFPARFNQREGTPDSALLPNPVLCYPFCDCLTSFYQSGKPRELAFHSQIQDTQSDAWKSLEEYIQKVEADGSDELNPMNGIGTANWQQIVALPSSIANLQSVKVLSLYGSHLVRVPPEIGEMANLEEFDVYTSYCLHWFPYEITHCKKLKRSRVSTRAIYGNYKNRAPFPRLPDVAPGIIPARCSVCHGPFTKHGTHQLWVSIRVATDVLPLLVHACSVKCVQKLRKPPEGYVLGPHQGGLEVEQPAARSPRYRVVDNNQRPSD
jgi:hypothetical protein